ncbi:MAG: hypothetical protein J0H68_02585 [Sphingobacteriia bacterium]|nr:hypothetical protein [Sphingobacteriia bacterium]
MNIPFQPQLNYNPPLKGKYYPLELVCSVDSENFKLIETFIAFGAIPFPKREDKNIKTYSEIIDKIKLKIFKILVLNKLYINAPINTNNDTLLHACNSNYDHRDSQKDKFLLLLSVGADPNLLNNDNLLAIQRKFKVNIGNGIHLKLPFIRRFYTYFLKDKTEEQQTKFLQEPLPKYNADPWKPNFISDINRPSKDIKKAYKKISKHFQFFTEILEGVNGLSNLVRKLVKMKINLIENILISQKINITANSLKFHKIIFNAITPFYFFIFDNFILNREDKNFGIGCSFRSISVTKTIKIDEKEKYSNNPADLKSFELPDEILIKIFEYVHPTINPVLAASELATFRKNIKSGYNINEHKAHGKN